MNKTAKTLLIVVAVVAILGGIRVALSLGGKQDDQKLISEALQESLQASKEGRPGGVLDKLSASFKFNDQEMTANTRQIADFIKKQKPDVTIQNSEAVITGDEARIVSPVDLKVNFLGQSIDRRLKEVTIVFRKEEAREFLVIPTRKWRLTDVRVPDSTVTDLLAQ
jgi:hypothetical protein